MNVKPGASVFSRSCLRRIVCTFCSLLLIAPPSLLAQVSSNVGPPAKLPAAAFALAEDDLNQIDEASVSIPVLQQALGTDPNRLSNWVWTQTRWLPYTGALKGPHGTLLARQGNLLDRSLLLAALLQASGREVRIAWFDTTPEQQKALRGFASEQSTGGVPDFFHISDKMDPDDVSGVPDDQPTDPASLLRAERLSAERVLRKDVKQVLTEQHDQLTALVGATFEPTSSDSWSAALNRYFFVEHRRPGNPDWEDQHLLAEPLKTDQMITRFSPEAIPQQFLHRITIRVVVVQGTQGEFTEQVALEHAVDPARLGSSRVRISITPLHTQSVETLMDDLSKSGDNKYLLRYLRSAHSWLPTIRLEDQQAILGKAIGQDGELRIVNENPSGNRSSEGVGSALEQLDLISGGSKDKKASFLSEVRVEFEVKAPGLSHPKKIIRPIYKETNPTPQSLNQSEKLIRSAAISSRADLLITGGYFDWSYAGIQQAREYLKMRLAFNYLANKENDDWFSQDDLSPLISVLKKLDVFHTKLYGIHALRSASGLFLSQPNILGFWKHIDAGQQDDARVISSIDFIENTVSSLDATSKGTFNAQLLSGLRDSIIETAVASHPQQALSTSSLFREDRGGGWLIIGPDDTANLQTQTLPPVAADAIQRDLAAGYMVVLRPDSGSPSTAWWRLNRHTGELLGMTGSRQHIGGGTTLVWTIVSGIIVALIIKFFIDRFLDVEDSPCHPAGSAPHYTSFTVHLKSFFAKIFEGMEALPGVGECGEVHGDIHRDESSDEPIDEH